MRRVLLLILVAFLVSMPCWGQTRNYSADHYGGWSGKPCAWPPPSKIAITNIVLSSGVYTATVSSTAGIGPTTSPNTRSVLVAGVTDSFYNSVSSDATPFDATVATSTTLTWTGSGSHAASSGGFIVPAQAYTQASAPLLCTPAGNDIFLQALNILVPPSASSQNATTRAIFVSKYASSNSASVNGEYNFDTQIANVNAIGSFSTSNPALPSKGGCGGCESLPEVDVDFEDWYSTNPAHLGGIFSSMEPTPDLTKAHDSNWHVTNTVGQAIYDPFKPAFSTFLQSYFLSYGSYNGKNKTSFEFIMFPGGIDNRSIGTGAGCAFDTNVVGKNDNDLAAMLIQTAPIVAAQTTDYTPTTVVYSDPLNYAKQLTTVPTGGCSYTTSGKECPLATLLSAEYGGSISALNTAWGTSYKGFGSAGVGVGYSYSWLASTVAADSVGTGDGSTLTFNATLSTGTIDQFSLQILVAGTPVAGDAAGAGTCIGPNVSSCTINYTTKALAITFTSGHAPANGAAITAQYEANGWGTLNCSTANTCGLMDEDGSGLPWGANKNTVSLFTVGASPSPGTEGYCVRTGNPGGFPASTWNQNAAADLNVYDSHIVAEYEDITRQAFKTATPNLLMGTAQFMGNWLAPAPCSYYKGANAFVDVVYTDMDLWDPIGANQSSYVNGCTSKPLYNETYSLACPDSAAPVAAVIGTNPNTCQGSPSFTTQPLRAAALNTVRTTELNNGHFIGDEMWGGQHDGDSTDSPVNNWGIMTTADNPYNANDASASSVSCTAQPGAANCGNEPTPTETGATRPFGDLFGGTTGLTATNALWFTPVVGSGGSQLGGGVVVTGGAVVNPKK